MGGKRVTKGVAGHFGRISQSGCRFLHRALEIPFIEMVSANGI
jgi:hypothetical protein